MRETLKTKMRLSHDPQLEPTGLSQEPSFMMACTCTRLFRSSDALRRSSLQPEEGTHNTTWLVRCSKNHKREDHARRRVDLRTQSRIQAGGHPKSLCGYTCLVCVFQLRKKVQRCT